MAGIIVLLISLLSSCSFFQEKNAETEVSIPPLPEEFSALKIKRYRVKITSGNGEEGFASPGDTKKIKAEIPVSGISSILIYPETENITLKPAGKIICSSMSAKTSLSWEEGFAAEIVSDLLSSGCDLSDLNFSLFKEKIKKISEGDPWSLDAEKIKYALEHKIFSASYIKKKKSRSLTLYFSGGESSWYAAQAVNLKEYKKDEKCIENLNIYEGENIFFDPETEESFTVFAGRTGWISFFSSGPSALSGNW